MSIWSRISDALSALAKGESLADVFTHLRTPPERSAGFAIAVIALGAKMAKADGQVTRDEVSAFREVFTIPQSEEKNAARLFNLARTDVAGFELYAQKVAAMFGPDDPALSDLLEGLFHIAVADGEYHPSENEFLMQVSEIFGMKPGKFKALRSRFVPVRNCHPDRMYARGVPKEAVKLAEKRLIAVNHAWEEINKERA